MILYAALGGSVQAATCSHRLLVSGFFSTVHVYDACSGAYIKDLDSGSRLAGAQAIRVGPDGLVYVVAELGDSVYRYRADTLEFVDRFAAFPAGTHPLAIDFGADGTAYVAGFLTNDVKKLDRNGNLLGNAMAPRASGLIGPEIGTSFGPDGNLYVPGFGSHTWFDMTRSRGSGPSSTTARMDCSSRFSSRWSRTRTRPAEYRDRIPQQHVESLLHHRGSERSRVRRASQVAPPK